MENCLKKMSSTVTDPLKILIIEDDLEDRKLMKTLLPKSSLSISELKFAECLENALELLSDNYFDVVLLDLNLPDSHGIDTLVKVSEKNPRTANIVVTGMSDESLGLEAVSKGAQEYLMKGHFDAQMLSKSIHYAIERKRVEYAIKESETQHRLLFEAANEAIFLIKDEQFIDCNPSTLRIFNCTREQIIGQSLRRFFPEKQTDERDSIELAQEKNNLALEGKPQFFEWRYVRYDETTFDAEVSLNRLELYGEVFTQAIVRDITERKCSAEAIGLAYERLEKANHELKQMQSQLVQNEKLASIGQLAAGVAHEMNTPVGFVASNFETLESYVGKFKRIVQMYDKLADEIETSGTMELVKKIEAIRNIWSVTKMDFVLEDVQGIFDDSREGLERITNIIQNLRDFSRIDQAGDFAEHNLNEGIEATLTVARNEIKYHADIETELSDIPTLLCNAGQINQVFLNILVNSAQAIKSEERDENGTIKIRTYKMDDDVVCEISDDGPGIPSNKVDKIFDPFFTTKPAGKGTGLGLSVSYDIIVNKHKGQLLVDSTLGKGTKFTIKLPVSKKIADDEEKMLVGAANNGKQSSIIS